MLFSFVNLASNMIQKDQNAFMAFISRILGFIFGFFFNIAYAFTENNSLGIAIILITIVVRLCMVPTGFSQQKSSRKMALIQPEINKIKEKYGNTKDPELLRKQQMEISQINAKNGVNMLGGCLPVLFTMPLFIALVYILRQSYLFVDPINQLYTEIADVFYSLPDIEAIKSVIIGKIPKGMEFHPGDMKDMLKAINAFNAEDWKNILAAIPEQAGTLQGLLDKKQSIEYFIGFNLIENCGFAFPGIIIPILSAVTSFFTSLLSMKSQSSANADPAAQSSQKMMMYAMPAMMFFFTLNVSAGVGVYWTVSNVFGVVQQYLMNKYYKYDPKTEKEKPKEPKFLTEKRALPDKKYPKNR